MIDLAPVGSRVVVFDRFANGSDLHEIRPSSNHGENFIGHHTPLLGNSHCPMTTKEPPSSRPMKNHRGDASVFLPSNANSGSDEPANAKERQPAAARDQFPMDVDTPAQAVLPSH